jgi:carbon storage regulator
MLILTRRKNEKIVIDGGIEITVVAIRGSKVQLGINAPPQVAVTRPDAKWQQKREAA